MATKQPQALTEAMSYVIANRSTVFFATFLMQRMKVVYDESIPTAATDGQTIWVGPWFCGLPILERVFVLCHEVMHAILDHVPRATLYAERGFGFDLLPFSHKRANDAQDYVINAALIESRIGKMPQQGLYRSRSDADVTWDEVYTQIDERPDDDSDDGSGGRGRGFDVHRPAPPGTKPGDRKQKQAVTQARNAAVAAGELPAGLRRIIDGVLNPTVPWTEELHDFMSVCAGKDETTWRKLNRRRLVVPPTVAWPGQDGFRMNCVVVAPDCSGSITDKVSSRFWSEFKAILAEVRPREVHVLWWDTEAVHEEVQIEDADGLEPEDVNAYGGGGTVYKCVPQMIRELDIEPDAVVCLTDGYVTWCSEDEITWPHLTVTTGRDAPFGKSIKIDVSH